MTAEDENQQGLVDFGALYLAHARDLRKFALYLSGDAAAADDLVSEALVRNLFLKQRRHERRHVSLDERLADGRPGPDERAGDQRELRLVLAALARLPEPDRAAVLMRADAGVPYEEIAAGLWMAYWRMSRPLSAREM